MEIKTRWAQDKNGKVIPFATVSLFYEGTTDPVTGLEDKDGSPLSNPFQADVNGKVVFAAPDGQYDIKFSSGPRESTASIQFLDVSGALQVVENIDTLRSISGNSGRDYIAVKFHTSDGDGGGGNFYWESGAAPGTYVDNNGTIIVPTGGDGSAAWLKDFSNSYVPGGYKFRYLTGAKDSLSASVPRGLAVGDTINITQYSEGAPVCPTTWELVEDNAALPGGAVAGDVTGAARGCLFVANGGAYYKFRNIGGDIRSWGAIPGGADCSPAVQAAIDSKVDVSGGTITVPEGSWYIASQVDADQSSRKIIISGAGERATVFTTDQDIIMFLHGSYFEIERVSLVQTGGLQGFALSTPTNKQAAHTRYEKLSITGFKFGAWLRYTLWCTFKDLRMIDNAVGMKLSRNATRDDPTNPVAPGGWNLDPGFFHNQNTFDNILCEGGEVGIWGSVNGCSFKNITTQRQSSAGDTNVAIPVGTPGIGLWLQGRGTGVRFGATGNTMDCFYSEVTKQPMILEDTTLSISSYYLQGGPSSGAAYEQAFKLTNSVLNSRSTASAAVDWFKYGLVAADSTIVGGLSTGSNSVGDSSLSNSNWYQSGVNAGARYNLSVTGVTTTNVHVAEPRCTYSITVVGVYDGTTVVSAKFEVAHWSSGNSRIISDAGNSTNLACSMSGNNIRIETTSGSQAYLLRVMVVDNRRLMQYPYSG